MKSYTLSFEHGDYKWQIKWDYSDIKDLHKTNNLKEYKKKDKSKSSEKKICCQTCQKMFRYNSQLKAHLRSHEKPFSCNICVKRFKKKFNLEKHLKIHNEKL